MIRDNEIVLGISRLMNQEGYLLYLMPASALRVGLQRITDMGGLVYKVDGVEEGCETRQVTQEELRQISLAGTRLIKLT